MNIIVIFGNMIVLQNYIASNFLFDTITLLLIIIGVHVIFIEGIDNENFYYFYFCSLLLILLKYFFSIKKLLLLNRLINQNKGNIPKEYNNINLYKFFKVSVKKENQHVIIRESVFKPEIISLDEINLDTSKILVLKNQWYNYNLRSMGWNSYYQIILITAKEKREILRFKNIGDQHNNFPYEEFKKLGENIAYKMGVEIGFIEFKD